MGKATVKVIMMVEVLLLTALFAAEAFAEGQGIVFISEIMYNPAGDDNNREFVEITGTGNLSGYSIGDIGHNDTLELLKHFEGNLSLIVEEGFDIGMAGSLNCSIYSAGAAIGDGLSNAGESVFLYFNGTTVDWINYTNSIGNGNNKSVERNITSGALQESLSDGGSPCFIFIQAPESGVLPEQPENGTNANFSANHPMNSSDLNNSSNSSNSSENLSAPIGNSAGNESGNSSVQPANSSSVPPANQSSNSSGNNSSSNFSQQINCRFMQGISVPSATYSSGAIQYRHVLNSTNASIPAGGFPEFSIEYWIEDIKGAIVKQKTVTLNTETKSYTPSYSKGVNVLFLKARLVQEGCSDSLAEATAIVNGTLPETAASCPVSKQEKASSGTCPSVSSAAAQYASSVQKSRGSLPSIGSFYTRSRNWNQNVTLNARIEGQGNVSIVLVEPYEIQEINITLNSTQSIEFIVHPVNEEPQGNYVLLAYSPGKAGASEKPIDVAVLKLDLKLPSEKTVKSDVVNSNANAEPSIDGLSQGSSEEKLQAPEAIEVSKTQPIGTTANVVYSSASENALRGGGFALALAGTAGIFLYRKWKKGISSGDCMEKGQPETDSPSGKTSGEAIDL